MLHLLLAPALAAELSLSEALDRAVADNPELTRARLELERSQWALTQARGAFDPSLSLGISQSGSSALSNDVLEVEELTTTTSGWSAGLSQPLPTGGSATLGWRESTTDSNSQLAEVTTYTSDSVFLSVSQPLLDGAGPRAARYGVRSADLGLSDEQLAWRAALEQLVLDVSDAYWGLVAARESHALARRSLEIAEGQLADTLERREEGFAGSGDVLQFERTVGVARQAEVVAAADVEAAEARLARLIGLPLSGREPIEPTDRPSVPEASPDLEASLALARGGNASWLRAALSWDRARLDFLAARNSALPDLNVTGMVSRVGGPDARDQARSQLLAGDFPSWSVGADMSLPLPARDARASYARARLAREQARADLEAAEQDLVLQVEAAVRAVSRDRVRLELAGQTLEAARQALAADQELLQEGKGSSRNVVLSLESLAEAQVSQLSAEIDLQASLLQLKRVEGTLLESLSISAAPD